MLNRFAGRQGLCTPAGNQLEISELGWRGNADPDFLCIAKEYNITNSF